MRIIKSRVVLDGEYRNVLVKEYSRNYPGMDKLSGPGEIAQVMDEVFGLTNQGSKSLKKNTLPGFNVLVGCFYY